MPPFRGGSPSGSHAARVQGARWGCPDSRPAVSRSQGGPAPRAVASAVWDGACPFLLTGCHGGAKPTGRPFSLSCSCSSPRVQAGGPVAGGTGQRVVEGGEAGGSSGARADLRQHFRGHACIIPTSLSKPFFPVRILSLAAPAFHDFSPLCLCTQSPVQQPGFNPWSQGGPEDGGDGGGGS